MAVALGLVGNNLDNFFVETEIQKIKNVESSHRNIDQELQQDGTNIVAPTTLIILVLVTLIRSI